MTHLDVMKKLLDDNPWEIAHRLWTCMECPKLKECMQDEEERKLKYQDKDGCRRIINKWLNELV